MSIKKITLKVCDVCQLVWDEEKQQWVILTPEERRSRYFSGKYKYSHCKCTRCGVELLKASGISQEDIEKYVRELSHEQQS